MDAFNIGAVVAHIKADVSDFEQGMKSAQNQVHSFKDRLSGVGETIGVIGKQAAIFTGVVGAGLAIFLKSSSEEASNFEKAMTSLDIIAGRFGVSGKKAQAEAKALGQELRIGTGAAAEGLQNLLKTGLTLDQSTTLLKRFTNEAITGKSSSISLATAVQNLSFAYATGNSALGNMSGVSENFSDITEAGRKSLVKKGKALSAITDDMAKYEGMINLTNLTLGSSDRFTGTLVDTQAQLEQKMTNVKIAVGQGLNVALNGLLQILVGSGLLDGLQRFTEIASGFITMVMKKDLTGSFLRALGLEEDDAQVTKLWELGEAIRKFGSYVAENQGMILTFLKGLAVALTSLLVIGTITGAITLLMNPLFLLTVAITGLYMAWETNFLGMRDIINNVVNFVTVAFNEYLLPAINLVTTYVLAHWEQISTGTMGAFNMIVGIIKIAAGTIVALFSIAIALLTGNWQKALDLLITAGKLNVEGLIQLFNGMVNMIKGFGSLLFDSLTSPFRRAWDEISKIVSKIKDGLDFTKRHSPSVVDTVNKGVGLVNSALDNLAIPLGSVGASLSPVGLGNGQALQNITIDLSGAIISDEAGAQRMGELMGDSIIRRLQTNIRI